MSRSRTAPSLLSRLMPAVMTLRGSKRYYASAELTRARVERLRLRPKPYGPPRGLERTVDITLAIDDGWPVYTVSPRGVAPTRRALYLHGGANISQVAPQHWRLVAELAAAVSARILLPIYPLAPDGTTAPVIARTTAMARALVAEVGVEHQAVLGDSAGGGMSLATAMQVRDAGGPVPRVILISPSLDLSLAHPDVAARTAVDPWLDIPGARAAAELYRGELPIDDPRVSPLNGSLDGLGAIQLFCGTRDMLTSDSRRLAARAADAGHPLEYHEVEGMIHVYPLLPIPEARRARALMVEFMTR